MSRTLLIALLAAVAALLVGASFGSPTTGAEATPQFRWPWAGSEGWRYTQGFHSDYALDFQPQIAPNCDDPVDLTHTIRPVAPGTVTNVRMRGSPQPAVPAGMTIDHGGAWSSYYTHLANVPDAVAVVGAQVGYNTNLGNPSCYTKCEGSGAGPPCASGRHIHIQIRLSGSGAGILQTTICGWTIGADGGISRDGTTHYPSKSAVAPISNTGCPAGSPPASTPLPSPTQPKGPTPTPLPVRGDANCDLLINPIDAAVLLQHSAGLWQTLCNLEASDTNGNGRVDPIDAQLVLQLNAGVIHQLPSA
jgi:hypothetical protein